MKWNPLYLLILIVLAALVAAHALVLVDLMDISLREPLPASDGDGAHDPAGRPRVRVGVISRFAPNIIYAGYQPIMDYLNRHGSYHYELRLSTSYQDAVDRLRRRDVDASFLGAWIYGHLGADDDLVPIVAPLNALGRSEFQSVLVTRLESDIVGIGDLKGRRVALPSAQSWSGNWLQNNALADAGLTVADLDSLHHFDHHQTVVWQVLGGDFDAGVVKESVADEYRQEGLKEVARSTTIPGPPLVGHRSVAPEIIDELRSLLLALDAGDPADWPVLGAWTPEFSHGFTAVDRRRYLEAFFTTEGAQ